jgi:hypothetical protein
MSSQHAPRLDLRRLGNGIPLSRFVQAQAGTKIRPIDFVSDTTNQLKHKKKYGACCPAEGIAA